MYAVKRMELEIGTRLPCKVYPNSCSDSIIDLAPPGEPPHHLQLALRLSLPLGSESSMRLGFSETLATATAGWVKWTIIVSGAICSPYMDWSGTGLCNSLQALLAYYT